MLQPDIKLLIERISEMAHATGFKQAHESSATPIFSPETFIFLSNYAILTVCFASNNVESLAKVWTENEESVSKVLLESEKIGMLIDGYIIIVLNEPPDDKLIKRVREIETDTGVCRKHIIWPDASNWNTRLNYVTILSLPESNKAEITTIDEKPLPPLAQEIFKVYETEGTYKAVLEFLEKKANED